METCAGGLLQRGKMHTWALKKGTKKNKNKKIIALLYRGSSKIEERRLELGDGPCRSASGNSTVALQELEVK